MLEIGSLPTLWLSEYHSPWDIYAHGITRVLAHQQTPFQQMDIVETGAYGKSLVLDGKWQSSTLDEFLYHEVLVHPAMICHGAPRRVLILGGGEGATVREVLRWQTVQQVVMVDIDGEVVAACREHLPEMHQGAFEDPRLELIIGDALEYLDGTAPKWDVVISDLSDPFETGPAFQLFTLEFFQRVQRVLTPGGIYSLQAGSIAPMEIQIHGRVMRTLGRVFEHTLTCVSCAPTYGVPLGVGLASDHLLPSRPDPEAIDRLLAEKTTGGFKLIDGITVLGLLQTPKHLREAVAAQTQVYTLKDPPNIIH